MDPVPITDVSLPQEQMMGAEVTELSERLQQSATPDRTPGALVRRRDDCTDARELAVQYPRVGCKLAPVLGAIVTQELERSYNNATDRMLLAGLSREIEHAAVQTIAEVSGPQLATGYRQSEQDVATLIEMLGRVVCNGRTDWASVTGIEVLSALTKSVPEVVATTLPAGAVPAIAERIQELRYTDRCRAGIRLLSVLAVHTDHVTATEQIQAACRTVEDRGNRSCQAYAALVRIRTGLGPGRDGTIQAASIDELVALLGDDVRTAEGQCRAAAARILGEICMLCSADVNSPADIREEIETNSGWDREAILEGLGFVVAFRPGEVEMIRATISEQIHNTTGPDRWHAARLLGEIKAATAERPYDVPSPLVNRVHETTGPDRRLPARALGFHHAYDDTGESVLSGLATRVQTGDGLTRRLRARALGEIVASMPAGVPKIPRAVIDDVRHTTDWDHWVAARVLGETAAVHITSRDPDHVSLIEEVATSTGRNRRLAARALGEVSLRMPERAEAIPTALREATTDWTGRDRWLAARVCGEFVAASENPDEKPLKEIRERFQSATGMEKRLAAEALGVAVGVASPATIDPPAPLISELDRATGRDRRLIAEVLGRVVASDTEAETRDDLIAGVRKREGMNRWRAARLLGELAAVRGPDNEAIPAQLVDRIGTTRDDERHWAARVVGEAVAVGTPSTISDRHSPNAYCIRREWSGVWPHRLSAR